MKSIKISIIKGFVRSLKAYLNMPNASDKAKLNMLEGVVNSYLEVSIADLEKQLKELG